ncbi:hypothetical protein [Rosenbergiella nectarea]|uniref:hypothetical protein n=1 Tax=Rosenbergiella nectarea TaxID=988801 RepID=UPI001BD9C5F6|nr:hypothetical protein [Rosenbergiella nectarea]MBT0730992.1 hypothetical protein [Rosenbergiella nectarea subsp. apis]
MRFIKLLLPLGIIAVTGCANPASITEEKLSTWTNDELCRGLGTYKGDGSAVLKIHAELEYRGSRINNERCYALENAVRSQASDFSITPTARPSVQERVFDKEKGKYILQQSGPRAGLDIRMP